MKSLPYFIIAIGSLLLLYMILTEDEPGGAPLILILCGIMILGYNRYKPIKGKSQ